MLKHKTYAQAIRYISRSGADPLNPSVNTDPRKHIRAVRMVDRCSSLRIRGYIKSFRKQDILRAMKTNSYLTGL